MYKLYLKPHLKIPLLKQGADLFKIPLYGGVPKAGWLKYDVFCDKPPLLSVITAQKSKKITKYA